MLASGASAALLGGLDAERVSANNHKKYKIAYVTAGNRSDPCVIAPPGGGSTKEEALFWTRELARIGPFFVVSYDLRGTGASEPRDKWSEVFSAAGTDPTSEMERVLGVQKTDCNSDAEKKDNGAHAMTRKTQPVPLNAAISNELHDFDAYIEDAFHVMDELGIEKAHFVGLSQGGNLARMAAMRYPDRVLSCVSCCSTADKVGLMMASMSEGAEEYYDQLKKANLFTKTGKATYDEATVTKDQYVEWRSKLLSLILPDHPPEIYQEMASKSYDAGFMTERHCSIAALAYEASERQGKNEKHLDDLKNNKKVPIMFVHGKKDPVIHFGEIQKLFAKTGNCVMETHEYGHNLGPPSHQTKMLGKMAMFMKKSVSQKSSASIPASDLGKDTFDEGVSAGLMQKISLESTVKDLWESFLTVQTAADTSFALGLLLAKLELAHLRGKGFRLFLALKPALEKAGLNFSQKKLLTDLWATLTKTQRVVARARGKSTDLVNDVMKDTVSKEDEGSLAYNDILVCGAGPVGLRTACELAMLGFHVTVVEKRPNFSRANILTFWDETMNDMLALGTKSYYPNLQPSGSQKILGTRQIQVCLLKTLMLFGGTVRYGTEICALKKPAAPGTKWHAAFRPYVKHRRAAAEDAEAKKCATGEGLEESVPSDAVACATDFQKSKDYGGRERANVETWDVDQDFLNGFNFDPPERAAIVSPDYDGTPVPFDVYVIAEGGWSDSTRKLGFSKAVDIFKPAFGLVANLVYDPTDLKEKNMKSQIHFALSKNWPLANCPAQAEFIEYLKGETHFFAMVMPKKNYTADATDSYLEKLKPEEREAIPDELIAQMRRASQQKGLLEMGVFRESFASGKACLAKDNVDMEKLTEMVRDITQELGLPATTALYPTNPIQLFDFSRRARCIDPVRLVRGSTTGSAPTVLSPADYLASASSGDTIDALVLPVGDALQEPIWTQGLGINRGFHNGMNQAFACLLAREKGVTQAVEESCKTHNAMCAIKWGQGHSGLAGSGSGSIGLKPFKEWDTDPRSRLPIK